jgi:hypothetical protein
VEAAGEPLLGELSKATAVAGDSMEADERWGVVMAPLVDVEIQFAVSARRFAARSQTTRMRPLNGRITRQ